MSLQSLDITRRSATTTPPPQQRQQQEVAKLIDVTKCIGCKACQSACQEWNDLREEVGINEGSYQNPHLHALRRPRLPQGLPVAGGHHSVQQRHRRLPGGALHRLRLLRGWLPVRRPAYLEKGRVSVGLEPACIKACPTQALVFGSKEDMIDHANDRIADLKERGFDQAGLYDPAGVGGTHVMYVLHHADQPQLYNDLPKEPTISPTVGLWKGVLKPLATAAMVFTALAGFFHYVTIGPNDAEADEEDHPT